MEFVLERYNYWIVIVLMMGGLYIVYASENMIKRLVGLSIFQTSVIFFYISLSKVAGGTAPILIDTGHHGETDDASHAAVVPADGHAAQAQAQAASAADAHAHAASAADVAHGALAEAAHAAVPGDVIYSNPLPHVLMLTAIVVGVATLSVGLALVVRIREAFGSIEMDEVHEAAIADGLSGEKAA